MSFFGGIVGGFIGKIGTFLITLFVAERKGADEQAAKDREAQLQAAKDRADVEDRSHGKPVDVLRDDLRGDGTGSG